MFSVLGIYNFALNSERPLKPGCKSSGWNRFFLLDLIRYVTIKIFDQCGSAIFKKETHNLGGSFFDYVDQILPSIDHLNKNSLWTLMSNSFNNIKRENLYIYPWRFQYLPCLVNATKERLCFIWLFLFHELKILYDLPLQGKGKKSHM